MERRTVQNGREHRCGRYYRNTDLTKVWGLWIWKYVDSTTRTETANIGCVCVCSTRSDLKSGKYRVKSTFLLTNGDGKSGTITIYSDEQKIG